MKQYEELYVPCQDEDDVIGYVTKSGVPDFPVEIKLDLIVITIEELREVYNAGGADRCAISEGNYSHSFDNYMKSKGISVNNSKS